MLSLSSTPRPIDNKKLGLRDIDITAGRQLVGDMLGPRDPIQRNLNHPRRRRPRTRHRRGEDPRADRHDHTILPRELKLGDQLLAIRATPHPQASVRQTTGRSRRSRNQNPGARRQPARTPSNRSYDRTTPTTANSHRSTPQPPCPTPRPRTRPASRPSAPPRHPRPRAHPQTTKHPRRSPPPSPQHRSRQPHPTPPLTSSNDTSRSSPCRDSATTKTPLIPTTCSRTISTILAATATASPSRISAPPPRSGCANETSRDPAAAATTAESSPRPSRSQHLQRLLPRLLDRPQRRIPRLVDPRLHRQQRRQPNPQHLNQPTLQLTRHRHPQPPSNSIRFTTATCAKPRKPATATPVAP